jgi:hypothetical protein
MDTLIGTFKIRKGNDNQEPMYVYVHGISAHSDDEHTLYVCNAPNSFNTVWSEAKDLIDFTTWEDYEIIQAEWHIEDHKRAEERWSKNLAELLLKKDANPNK